ncbi:MAG: TRAP transporter substrate-binding protein DctP [Desulfobacterales bacterium]|jgi:TRAP-type C4-dicarboxylate transport system substrate-binding protein
MKIKMKSKLSIVGCILLTLTLMLALLMSIGGGQAMAAEKTTLVLETGLAKTAAQTWSESAEKWTKRITGRTDGAVQFDCHFGGELVSMIDILKGTSSGMIDVGACFTGYYPAQFPMDTSYGTLYTPAFTLEDPERVAITRILYAKLPAVSEAFTKNNLKKLFTLSTPGAGIICSHPIDSLKDFKGLKIRTFGKNMPALIKAVGAVPVSFAFSEVLDGLHKGVIDGTVTNLALGRDMKLDEVAPHVIWLGPKNFPGHMIAYSYVMNLKKWNSLPASVQRIILEESKIIEMAYAEYSVKEQAIASQQMVKRGATAHTLSDADLKEWQKRLGDIQTIAAKALDEKGLPGTESMAMIKKLAKLSWSDLMDEYDKAWEQEYALIK